MKPVPEFAKQDGFRLAFSLRGSSTIEIELGVNYELVLVLFVDG